MGLAIMSKAGALTFALRDLQIKHLGISVFLPDSCRSIEGEHGPPMRLRDPQ